MRLLAHRTGMANAPENSMTGFKQCFIDGAIGIECDITFIHGEPFVWLDGMEKHLEIPCKSLHELSLDEIRALKRKDCNETILTINDLFAFIKQYPTRVYLDIKYYSKDVGGELKTIPDDLITAVIDKIIQPAKEKRLCHKLGFVTFNGGIKLLKAVKKEDEEIATSLIVLSPWGKIAKHAKYLDSISIGWKYINHWKFSLRGLKKIIKKAKANKIWVYGGIANSEKEIRWLLKRDVDGIWTDDIPSVKAFFQKHHKKRRIEMHQKRRILITGSEGYLASELVKRLKADDCVEKIIGIDIKNESVQEDEKYSYIKMSVLDTDFADKLMLEDFDTIIHTAWTFNPTHDVSAQDKLDIVGTLSVLEVAERKKIKHLVYLGSTTGYGPMPENPLEAPFLKEEDWSINSKKRKSVSYRYAKNKAIVDEMIQKFEKEHPETNVFWVRASIVVGPNTKNIVSYIAESPFTLGIFMFRVMGYDPPMQFLSEYDMNEILYRACMEHWSGVVNVAGSGVVKYSEMIQIMGKRELCLPSWILYPATELLWRLRLFKFPSSLLGLIRYPWMTDTNKLRKKYNYEVRYSSRDALEHFISKKVD